MEKKMENDIEAAIYIYIEVNEGYMSHCLNSLKEGYIGG